MGSNVGTGIDKPALEREWIGDEARKLGKDAKARWMSLAYTVRPYIYFDKILIVWAYVNGQPQVKDIFTITSVDGSFQGGLWAHAKSKVTGDEIVITHQPRRLAADLDVFAWLPFFNELRYVSADWNNPVAPRNLRLSACFKMAEDPRNTRLKNDQHYLSELHTFREQFPQYRTTRF